MNEPNPYAPPSAEDGEPMNDAAWAAREQANWALGLAIASFLCCAPITAPIAIYKAHRSLKIRSSRRAILAIVLAGLSLLSWFLAWRWLDRPMSQR